MVVVLALLAALLFALAGAAEQRAASRVLRPVAGARRAAATGAAARRRMSLPRRLAYRPLRGLHAAGSLIRSPLWLAGWGADGLGFATQAGAVHAGQLSVVQPLLVTTLLFSLPLAALGGRRRPRWSDWAGAASACTGLALVLAGRRTATSADAHPARLLAAAVLATAVAGGLVLAARGRAGFGRAVALSVAAGMMFALGAAFTKLVSDSLLTRGIAATAGYWPAYALAAVCLAGLVLQQSAFSAGSLPATMAALTITDPLVSYGLGVTGFGELAPHGPGPAILTAAGLGLLCTGIRVLARSPLLHRADPASAAGEGLPGPDGLAVRGLPGAPAPAERGDKEQATSAPQLRVGGWRAGAATRPLAGVSCRRCR